MRKQALKSAFMHDTDKMGKPREPMLKRMKDYTHSNCASCSRKDSQLLVPGKFIISSPCEMCLMLFRLIDYSTLSLTWNDISLRSVYLGSQTEQVRSAKKVALDVARLGVSTSGFRTRRWDSSSNIRHVQVGKQVPGCFIKVKKC